MEVGQFLIAVGICFLTVQFIKLLWARRKFPPGPVPFPIFGSLWRIGWKVHQDTFIKLANSYGDVFTLWIGHIPVVVVTGFKAVRNGLIDHPEAMCRRPIFPFFKILGNEKGIMFSNGKTWKQQRQFGKSILQKLGQMKKGLEHHIEEEACQLVETFAHKKGQPLDPSLPIMHSASKIIHAAVFGQPVLAQDDAFQKLIEHINNITKFRGTFGEMMYNIYPSLVQYIPGPHKKALSSCECIHSLIKKKIENYKNSQASHEPQSYTDFYLAHMDKEKKDSTSTFHEDNLVQVIIDLFIAGTDTIAVTLSWGLFLMVVHPDIQASPEDVCIVARFGARICSAPEMQLYDLHIWKRLKAVAPRYEEKVRKEIENALDPSKTICYEDRKKLPYSQAVIHEIQRLSSILFYTLSTLCTTDLNIFDSYIPKGSLVIPDLCSVLLDPKQWETPQQFNPNHFLDEDGKFAPREEFFAFGAGCRECLGKPLAQMELFIFFTNLMKTFTFQQPEGMKEVNMQSVIGGGMQLRPLKICAISH